MDNSSDSLYIDFSLCNERIINFLTSLAALKGLRIIPTELGRVRFPAIRFMGLAINGLPAVTELILETKPAPEILPADPRRRALLREYTGAVLLHEMDLKDLAPLYKDTLPKPAHQIDMLDLAIAGCASPDLAADLQWINAVNNNVQEAINLPTETVALKLV